MKVKIQIPPAFEFLFQPARVKVAEGGRGSGKSENIGRYLLIKGMEQPENIVCGREFQASIKDSVHSMLAYFIYEYGLESEYQVLDTEIRGRNGTQFSFVGLRRNINNIKSMHNVKRFWGEEAQTFTRHSLDILFPTIRAENSELLFSMNADLEEDPAWQMLVVNPPPNSIVRHINYNQNPYFPEVLRTEMEHMKEKDYQRYLNVWEGQPKAAAEGAIFASEMTKAQVEGRITHVPYDRSKPVDITFDLGRSDKTAMWFPQQIGLELRFLHYYENNGEHFSHYIKYAKELPYTYGTIYLPHDADNELLSAERTIKQQVIAAFPGSRIVIVPRIPKKALAIDAARGIMDRSYFDKEGCADGLTCLRKYGYKVDAETGRISREPDHDTPWSHGADSYMNYGQSMLAVRKPKQQIQRAPLPRYLTGRIS